MCCWLHEVHKRCEEASPVIQFLPSPPPPKPSPPPPLLLLLWRRKRHQQRLSYPTPALPIGALLFCGFAGSPAAGCEALQSSAPLNARAAKRNAQSYSFATVVIVFCSLMAVAARAERCGQPEVRRGASIPTQQASAVPATAAASAS